MEIKEETRLRERKKKENIQTLDPTKTEGTEGEEEREEERAEERRESEEEETREEKSDPSTKNSSKIQKCVELKSEIPFWT